MNRKKERLIKNCIIVMSVLIMIILAWVDHGSRTWEDGSGLVSVSGQKIKIYEDETGKYLFLPGYAKGCMPFDDEMIMQMPDETTISSTGEHAPIGQPKEALTETVTVMYSAKIPAIFIETATGSMDKIYADKDYKEAGKITVYDADGTIQYRNGIKYLKGHGNVTWNTEIWDKKSFGFELRHKTPILGMEKAEEYTLMSNASEPTLIRNHLARELEIELLVPYARTGVFVDLYLNGEYQGNYYLCDNFETDDFIRAGGFAVEREFTQRYEQELARGKTGFVTDLKEPFIIPEAKKYLPYMLEHIQQVLNQADQAIAEGATDYQSHIDLYSFGMRYLAEEVTKNYDAGVSSAFFYQDRSGLEDRIYYGPGWDYDLSLGNYLDWMDYAMQDGTGMTYGCSGENASMWFAELYDEPDFCTLVKEQYHQKAYPFLQNMIEYGIDDCAGRLTASAAMDAVRWAQMYEKCGYTVGDEAEYDALKQFVTERSDFLLEKWSN